MAVAVMVVETFLANQWRPVKTEQIHGFICMSKESNGYANMVQFMRKKFLIVHDRLSALRQHASRPKQNKNYFNMGSRNMRLENDL